MICILVIILVLLISPLYAPENVEVELYKNRKSIPLNTYHKTYLYGNTIGYLSTCRHLEKVTGNTDNKEDAAEVLAEINSGDHLKISFTKGSPKLPIAYGNDEVDELYVGFDKKGFPNIISMNEDKIQLYSKCSGSIAITNFSCDQVLSELLSFELDQEKCRIYKNHIIK